MRTLFFAASAVLAVSASPAAAAVDPTAPTGGFTYGTGNNYAPANAVIATQGTSELATRFHVTGQPATAPNGNTYVFDLGTRNISFDYSILNPGVNTQLTLTNLLTGQSASYNPLISDNSVNSAGAFQNSQQLGFGFLNGGFSFGLVTGSLGFNPNINDTYRLDLRSGANTVTAFAQVGTGAVAAVPEPATWALMLLGFGGMGVAMRRSRKTNALRLQIA